MAKYKNYNDYKEDLTMREIHRIQEDMERQYKKSGLPSYWDWLQATEDDLRKSLAEVGFEIVTRNGRTFLDEIKPRPPKSTSKSETYAGKEKYATPVSLSTQVKMAKHKNYDDFFEDSTVREIHQIREEMEQQYRKSGFSSYDEWLKATEPDMRRSLAEAGFEIVTRDGRTVLNKIKPQPRKKPIKYKTKRRRTTSRK